MTEEESKRVRIGDILTYVGGYSWIPAKGRSLHLIIGGDYTCSSILSDSELPNKWNGRDSHGERRFTPGYATFFIVKDSNNFESNPYSCYNFISKSQIRNTKIVTIIDQL